MSQNTCLESSDFCDIFDAIKNNHIWCVKYNIYANKYNDLRIDITFKNGFTIKINAVDYAVACGRIEIFKLLCEIMPHDIEDLMACASINGQLHMLRSL